MRDALHTEFLAHEVQLPVPCETGSSYFIDFSVVSIASLSHLIICKIGRKARILYSPTPPLQVYLLSSSFLAGSLGNKKPRETSEDVSRGTITYFGLPSRGVLWMGYPLFSGTCQG